MFQKRHMAHSLKMMRAICTCQVCFEVLDARHARSSAHSLLVLVGSMHRTLAYSQDRPVAQHVTMMQARLGTSPNSRVHFRRTHPVKATIIDNKDCIRVLLYSAYTTITGWEVFRTHIIAHITPIYYSRVHFLFQYPYITLRDIRFIALLQGGGSSPCIFIKENPKVSSDGFRV